MSLPAPQTRRFSSGRLPNTIILAPSCSPLAGETPCRLETINFIQAGVLNRRIDADWDGSWAVWPSHCKSQCLIWHFAEIFSLRMESSDKRACSAASYFLGVCRLRGRLIDVRTHRLLPWGDAETADMGMSWFAIDHVLDTLPSLRFTALDQVTGNMQADHTHAVSAI